MTSKANQRSELNLQAWWWWCLLEKMNGEINWVVKFGNKNLTNLAEAAHFWDTLQLDIDKWTIITITTEVNIPS